MSSSLPIHAPGGAIPPGVLDPTIARSIRDERRARHDHLVSTEGTLAEVTRGFFDFIHRRHIRPLNSLHYDGLARTRAHDHFPTPPSSFGAQITMVDIDELAARDGMEFNVKQPVEGEQPYETDEQTDHCTPQFFLRNVMRVEREPGLPVPPYQIEVYADAEVFERIETHEYVTNFQLPDIVIDAAERSFAEAQERHQAIFVDADWEVIHRDNAWRSPEREIRIPSLYFGKIIQRKRGRFANAEEAKAEAEAEGGTRKKGLSTEEFLRQIRDPSLR